MSGIGDGPKRAGRLAAPSSWPPFVSSRRSTAKTPLDSGFVITSFSCEMSAGVCSDSESTTLAAIVTPPTSHFGPAELPDAGRTVDQSRDRFAKLPRQGARLDRLALMDLRALRQQFPLYLEAGRPFRDRRLAIGGHADGTVEQHCACAGLTVTSDS